MVAGGPCDFNNLGVYSDWGLDRLAPGLDNLKGNSCCDWHTNLQALIFVKIKIGILYSCKNMLPDPTSLPNQLTG